MIRNNDGLCANSVNGGFVTTQNGQTVLTITTINDGTPDPVQFDSLGANASASYAYVVTDENDVILNVLAGDVFDFDTTPDGTYRVYGISYTGTLTAQTGQSITGTLSDLCADASTNFVTVTLVDNTAPCLADAGTITPQDPMVEIENGIASITGVLGGDQVIPPGYSIGYALVIGPNQELVNLSVTQPTFTVNTPETYTIVTVVAQVLDPNDPNYINPFDFLVPGTTSQDFLDVIDSGICADVDTTGATFVVTDDIPGIGSGPTTGFRPDGKTGFTVFPNPTADVVQVDVSKSKIAAPQGERITVRLLDASGRIVRVSRVALVPNQLSFEYRLGAIPPGNYILQLLHRERIESLQVQKL